MNEKYEFYKEVYRTVVQNKELDHEMILSKLCEDEELYSDISDLVESRIKDIITGRFDED